MSEVEACTRALVEAILNSKDYADFRESSDRIKAMPEKKHEIQEFRNRVYHLQNGDDEGLDLYETIQWVSEEAEIIRRDSDVDQYLRRELRVCRMMQQIYMEIAQAVDLDVEDIRDNI